MLCAPPHLPRCPTLFSHSRADWQFKYNDDITTVSGKIEGFYHANGTLQEGKVAALSRTYARAVAGTPLLMRFDPSTAAFRLRYLVGPGAVGANVSSTTDIFMNLGMHYPPNASGHSSDSRRGRNVGVLNGTAMVRQTPGNGGLDVTAAAGVTTVDVAVVRPRSADRPLAGTYHTSDGDSLYWNISSPTSASAPSSPSAASLSPQHHSSSSSSSSSSKGAAVGFSLSTASGISWWKQIKVYGDVGTMAGAEVGAAGGGSSGDSGVLLCSIEMQDNDHGPHACLLEGAAQHAVLFDWRIELWKAKTLGVHVLVDTIRGGQYFGPLLGEHLALTWTKD